MPDGQLPQGEEKVRAVRTMFDTIAPRYDLVNRIMTFRLDVRWRKRAVRTLRLPVGSRILDLASGTGDLCIDLRKAGYVPLSFDLSFGMLSADRSGVPRVQADILRLPLPDCSIRFGNNIYFGKMVPRIGALLSDGPAYRYLPKSVAYLPPREELTRLLREAGFPDARHEQLSGGLTQLLSGTRHGG